MKPIEELAAEHDEIKGMLRILAGVTQKLEAGKKVNIQDLESIVEFLQVFGDRCHHAKEEEVLIPAMEEVGIPRSYALVESVLADHELSRAWVQGIAEGVSEYRQEKTSAAPKIIENTRYYLSLLGEHIKKEDYGLFPFAHALISSERQGEMLEGFEKIEERIGPGKHEEFLSIIDRLKDVYPMEGNQYK